VFSNFADTFLNTDLRATGVGDNNSSMATTRTLAVILFAL
jgi:hypothetical protein